MSQLVLSCVCISALENVALGKKVIIPHLCNGKLLYKDAQEGSSCSL